MINLSTTINPTEDTTGRGTYHRNLIKLLERNGFEVQWSERPIPGASLHIGTPDRLNRYDGGNAIRIIHSEAKEMNDMSNGGIIYVANHIRDKYHYPCKSDMVWWPMVDYPAYHEPRKFRGVIGQVNLYRRKGGDVFWQMVAKFPQYKFIGVKGWGKQLIPKTIPEGVEIREYNPDLSSFYKDIDILMIPSESEGLPTVALEAQRFGVPVVGSIIPGNIEAGVICCTDYEVTIRQVAKDYEVACFDSIVRDANPDTSEFINFIQTYL